MHFNLLGLTTTVRTFTQHFPPPGTIELSSSIEKRSPPREKNVTWSWGKNLREERGGHRARPTSRGAPVAGGSPPGGRQLGVGFVGKRLPVCATALSKGYYFNFIIERASQTAHRASCPALPRCLLDPYSGAPMLVRYAARCFWLLFMANASAVWPDLQGISE